MKKTSCCLALLLFLFGAGNAKAQKSIAHYFLELPETSVPFSKEKRQKLLLFQDAETAMENGLHFVIEALDYPNGYMRISSTGDGSGRQYEITYFKLSNGDRLVAVNHIEWAMCCEDSTLSFYRYNKGDWVDMTDSTLKVDILDAFIPSEPVQSFVKNELYGQLRFTLPQKGKEITAALSETFYYIIYQSLPEDSPFSAQQIEDAIAFDHIKLTFNDGHFDAGSLEKRE